MKKLLICLLILACLTGLCFAAEAKTADLAAAKWTDGMETLEGTLQQCLEKVNEKGGTLTLLDDVKEGGTAPTMRNDIDDADYIIGSVKAFTLDMNGHSLDATCGGIYVNPGEEGGIFVVKNGKIKTSKAENIYIANCGLQVLDMELRSVYAQNISYYDATDRYNKDNLIENSVITNPIWHGFVFNNRKKDQSATNMTFINSTIAVVFESASIGTCSGGKITLGEGVKLYSYGPTPKSSNLQVFGESFTKTGATQSTILGETYDALNEWVTPAKATVDLTKVIPVGGEPVTKNSPATRTYTLTPLAEQQPAAQEQAPTQAEKPAEKAALSVEAIAYSAAALVVVLCIVAVVAVLKKKK